MPSPLLTIWSPLPFSFVVSKRMLCPSHQDQGNQLSDGRILLAILPLAPVDSGLHLVLCLLVPKGAPPMSSLSLSHTSDEPRLRCSPSQLLSAFPLLLF